MRTGAIVAAVVVAVVAADVARADEPDDDSDDGSDTGYIGKRIHELEIDKCPITPDLADAEITARASAYYDRGMVLYEQGDYEGASREFITAYCLKPLPRVLKQIGQSLERRLDFERAIGYFERFIKDTKEDSPDKRLILTRIQVLSNLPAQIKVASNPKGAKVTLISDIGRKADGFADGDIIEVLSGVYTMTIEQAGYATRTETIDVQIGKPYSFYYQLDALKGRLKVRAIPADTRITIDGKLAGFGSHDAELPRGSYDLVLEASGRQTDRRRVEVRANTTTETIVTLPLPPQSGRTQLVIFSGVAGAGLGAAGVAVIAQNNATLGLIGSLVASGAAVAGAYFGVPDDYALGSSSFVITSGLVGGGEAILFTLLATGDPETAATAAGLGLIAASAGGLLVADRFNLDAGDAALLNSGALWGTVAGGLFAAVFTDTDPDTSERRIQAGLTLTGLNAGVLAGVLLGRKYQVSRRHVALIDLAGVGGVGVSAAVQGLVDSGDAASTERRAHFAIGGVAVGLLAGAYLTRNMDSPKALRLAPTVTPVKDANGNLSIGVSLGGSW
jgi:hypothetical protein